MPHLGTIKLDLTIVSGLCWTIVYGALGEGAFPHGSFLILTLGIFCSVFDLMYIWLLAKAKPAANA
jgi:hypothetical protein